jgi:hypothetical protein
MAYHDELPLDLPAPVETVVVFALAERVAVDVWWASAGRESFRGRRVGEIRVDEPVAK